MTHIFDTSNNSMSRSSSQTDLDLPSTLYKSETPIMAAAIEGHFASEWESQLNQVILKVLQRSMLDESVAIGTVVLLDLLGDLYKMGQYVDGDRSRVILAPYPQEDYIRYFKGAFMLAFRLLSKEKPESGYWEQVMREDDLEIATDVVVNIEDDFRRMLEENINCYPPLPISPNTPAHPFNYAGERAIPPNAFIGRLRYLQTKSTMYAHIRVLRTSRGEGVPTVHPNTKVAAKRDLALHFPPCHEDIMEKLIHFDEIRRSENNMWCATNKQVHNYLESKKKAPRERVKPLVGLGLSIGIFEGESSIASH